MERPSTMRVREGNINEMNNMTRSKYFSFAHCLSFRGDFVCHKEICYGRCTVKSAGIFLIASSIRIQHFTVNFKLIQNFFNEEITSNLFIAQKMLETPTQD